MIFAFMVHSHHHAPQTWGALFLEIGIYLAASSIIVFALWLIRWLEKISRRRRRRKENQNRKHEEVP